MLTYYKGNVSVSLDVRNIFTLLLPAILCYRSVYHVFVLVIDQTKGWVCIVNIPREPTIVAVP